MKKNKKIVIPKETKKQGVSLHSSTEWIFQFWAWQLLAWSFYRYFFTFSEPIDEFIVKPLVFVAPVIWYVLKREKRPLASIGITRTMHVKSLLIGFGFGLLFAGEAIAANMMKYGSLHISPSKVVQTYGIPLLFLLSFATAFSEELLSRGFFFSRLYEQTKRMWYSALVSSLLFVAFHIPILMTTLRFTGPTLIMFFLTNIVLGVANSFVYHKTKSLVAPILIHLFWNVTVAIFL